MLDFVHHFWSFYKSNQEFNMKFSSLLLAVLLSFFSVATLAETVNLNKADASAFQHYLEGIGEKRAGNIVSYRKKNGSFKKLDDLLNVEGIGEKIFKKIKSDLSLTSGVTTAPDKKDKKKTNGKTTDKEKSDTASSKDKPAKSKKDTATKKDDKTKTADKKKADKKDNKSADKKNKASKPKKKDDKKADKKKTSDKK
jgi:competence protein ComEA